MTLNNASHERFAQMVASGRSQSDAYREVYPRSRRWRDESVHERASKVTAKVLPRVRELQESTASVAIADRDELAKNLTVFIRGEKRKPMEWLAAIDRLARLMGYYAPDRQVVREYSFKPDAEVFQVLRSRGRQVRGSGNETT